MKSLVIFDLDGTLLNTVADIAAATNHALSANGYPKRTVEEIRSFIGNGINKLFERALPEGSKGMEEVLRIRASFIPYYNEHGCDATMPFPGIPELLGALDGKGIKLAVASNKYNEATCRLIRTYFPGIRFSSVLGQRDGIPTKPDPAVIYEICSEAGIGIPEDRESILYVGDSEVDMLTGANAGIPTVGVTWGCKTREQLEKHGPVATVDRPAEIFGIAYP